GCASTRRSAWAAAPGPSDLRGIIWLRSRTAHLRRRGCGRRLVGVCGSWGQLGGWIGRRCAEHEGREGTKGTKGGDTCVARVLNGRRSDGCCSSLDAMVHGGLEGYDHRPWHIRPNQAPALPQSTSTRRVLVIIQDDPLFCPGHNSG